MRRKVNGQIRDIRFGVNLAYVERYEWHALRAVTQTILKCDAIGGKSN